MFIHPILCLGDLLISHIYESCEKSVLGLEVGNEKLGKIGKEKDQEVRIDEEHVAVICQENETSEMRCITVNSVPGK
jgi:hypothetical protein